MYPEHEKLAKIQKESQIIGEFLDWLQNEQEVHLMKYSANPDTPNQTYNPGISIEEWLYLFFGIDKIKIEAEKRSMLQTIKNSPF